MARRKDSPQKAAMREMMRDYPKNNDMDEQLNKHLHEIDTHCHERMELPVEQTKARVGITEKLKATDQMNNVRRLAEKIILIKLIYV